MHPVLLEQDHRQQAGAAPAARDDVERCRWLGDLLAIAAGELLAHGLLDEPVPWHDVEGLGDDLAHLGEPMAAAAGAGGRRRHDHPLAWQVRRQRPACRAAAAHGLPRPCRAGSFGGHLVLGCGLLELGELELELLDQPVAALAGLPEPLAAGFGEQQLETLDLEPGAGDHGFGLFARAPRSARIMACAAARSAARNGLVAHEPMQAHPELLLKPKDI